MSVGHGENEKSRRYRQRNVLGIAFRVVEEKKIVLIMCKNKQLTTLKRGHVTRKVVR